MPAIRLGLNTRINLDGQVFAVRRKVGNGIIQLEGENDGELRNVSRDEIASAVMAGNASIVHADSSQVSAQAKGNPADIDLSALPQSLQKEVRRRHAYVAAVESPTVPLTGRLLHQACIAEVAERIGDAGPPVFQTLYRWLKKYRDSGGDVRSLIPNSERRGNRKRRFPQEVQDVIQRVIQERFLITERPRVSDIIAAVQVDIQKLNTACSADCQLPVPSYRTLLREVKQIDRYQFIKGRYGKKAADMDSRSIGPGVTTSRPLERVEIDHTKLDIIVCDDLFGVPIGRPWLTVCIDHFTRMPVGYYMGFTPPSTDSVLLALRNSIRPKDWVRQRHPDVTGDWPCYGIPEVLVTDNGAEFHSQDLELASLQLGMSLQHTKVKAPWTKGVVERFFGEVNRALLGGIPGTTFNSVAARGDYDPQGNAKIRLSQLDGLLCKWFVDVHGAKVHSGISDIPARRWRESADSYPPRLPADIRDLDILLARSSDHKLRQLGIQLNGLWYNNEALVNLRSRSQKNVSVSIKFDPQDISTIHVLDPETRRYFPVATTAKDYAVGLGLWQHKVIVRQVRERNEGAVDLKSLALEKERLHEMIEESMAKPRRREGLAKAGRFLEAGGKRRPPEDHGGIGQHPPMVGGAVEQSSPALPEPAVRWFEDEDDDVAVTFDMSRTAKAERATP
ncbi:hypothetical protein N825_20740 [Skermanella stibiiresistens SB22]|uniref:Integrase catalytic domain-containing protein n=1 Tax=Skermanella stibiiresistens SB22 TaxID=1385369 RepID=W9GXF1_9PROT|nr:Mu transposase C-terminal domain-containing protein [Skermanella stibiiresistens]EWY37311.1 hypothetical protein N825_20740 [Skermanella stibiiresistens SB22]